MRILIVSDSHRYTENLYRIFLTEKFDAVIHLGDYEGADSEIKRELEKKYPLMPIKFVRGNCDDDISVPDEDVVSYSGVRIFMCHGHRYRVNMGRELLAETARNNCCEVALYGHTHKPDLEVIGGVEIFNPGSISEPRQYPPRASYGILEIDNKRNVSFRHVFVD